MKNKGIFRIFALLMTAVLCISLFSMTAFASDGGEYEETPETSETGEPEVSEPEDVTGDIELVIPEDISSLLGSIDLSGLDIGAIFNGILSGFGGMGEDTEEETEPPVSLTPDGNMSLVDDITGESAGDKQFITVVTKNGNYFYIIIDRAEDGTNTVHFLNQVDERDLFDLMEEEETESEPVACICTDKKCSVGDIDTKCPVCIIQIGECVGVTPEPTEPTPPADGEKEPDSGEEKKGGNVGLIALVVLILVGGGGAAVYFLVIKPKNGKSAKVPSTLDDFDLEDEEYLIEEESETADEDTTEDSE